MSVRIEASQVARFAADLTGDSATANSRLATIARHHGALLETKVKANIHALFGRPGVTVSGRPLGKREKHTGDYRRSVARETTTRGSHTEVVVGSEAPQARRLEFGFVGTDSLGRRYNQPPYPHWRTAMDEIEPLFVAAVVAAFGRAPA